MAVALIFAGGRGVRMNGDGMPKQFLEVDGKAIIIHTIEHFEKHREIEQIVVVCTKGWIEHLEELLVRYQISKVQWIIEGDTTSQGSIYNGLQVIKKNCEEDAIVLIHDGVRPLIDENIISRNIAAAKKHGTAITVSSAKETVVSVNTNGHIEHITERSNAKIARAPQTFYLRDILRVHEQAKDEGIVDMIDSASLMKYYGHSLHTVEGNDENIKLTTPSDLYMFKGIYEERQKDKTYESEK